MKTVLSIAILAIGAAALVLGVSSCKRSKASNIITDESNQDYASMFGGELDSFKVKGGNTIDIFSIKHGSLAIRSANKWIYVDPVTKAAQPVTDYTNLPKADYILITHDHGDHLDPAAIAQLATPDTRIIANPGSVQKASDAAKGEGVTSSPEVIGLGNGEGLTTAEGWNIDAVPAYNSSPEKQNFHPQGVGNGYLVTIDGFRIYVAGDTEDIPELADLNDVDVAFLPCNLPYTMTPEQCANAARMFSPKVLFPYHYGETDVQQVVNLLSGTATDVRIRPYK